MGENAQVKAFRMVNELHKCGVAADCDLCARGLKAQMKYADKIKAKYTIVLGDNEIESGKAELKNMKTGEQTTLPFGEVSEFFA
jgi:histidyl-tRNA synthetase